VFPIGRQSKDSGNMTMDPSHDFDFHFGSWKVHHRQLRKRLANCDEWTEFGGSATAGPLLGGRGNMDDNLFHKPDGDYRGVTLRSFDPTTKTWAIWWLDERWPHTIDAPMIGRFEDGVGTFYADETFEGKPIRVRFLWLDIAPTSHRWEQAFSPDGGKTWETNWITIFTKA
jgi:hypothetical protein